MTNLREALHRITDSVWFKRAAILLAVAIIFSAVLNYEADAKRGLLTAGVLLLCDALYLRERVGKPAQEGDQVKVTLTTIFGLGTGILTWIYFQAELVWPPLLTGVLATTYVMYALTGILSSMNDTLEEK